MLQKILKKVTLHYWSSEEPTMTRNQKDFYSMRQHCMAVTDYYKEFTDMENPVDEMSGNKGGGLLSSGSN